MPFARIDLVKGKSIAYRAAVADVVYKGILPFYQYVVDELQTKLSIRPDDVMINMVFVAREDWSFGRGQPWN